MSAGLFVNGVLDFLKRLGPARIGAMVAVTAALIGFFAFVIMRVTQPDMALLYSDLSFQDSSAITRDLDSRAIKYELRGDGQAILVPRAEITKLRMELAGKGLPSGGGVGYEIFDKGDAFSATSFVQNINHLRALEGELARTIRTISRVQQARVHLVIPERRLFERDREGPRASIVLKLAGELDSSQVRAIRHLAATAVDGLKPERISIVDERGRLLADGAQGESPVAVMADEKQAAYERRLRGQVEEIVAGIVGQGRARVQISAEMDMNRVENRSESFDPESRVVRSTQTRNEASATDARENGVSVANELPAAGANAQQGNGSRDTSSKNEEIVNYEISRSTRTEVVEAGRVKRLSVAVLVDGVYQKPAGGGDAVYAPRSPEELERISSLVRTAVGYDKARGDQIEVVNLRFADPPPGPEAIGEGSLLAPFLSFGKDDILRGVEIGILALLSLVVLLTVVRPLVRQILKPETAIAMHPMIAALTASPEARAAAASDNDFGDEAFKARDSKTQRMLDIVKVNGQVAAASVERIGEMVKNNPQETVAVLRQWIHESA